MLACADRGEKGSKDGGGRVGLLVCEEWMEGNLKGNYLRLIPGLCLEVKMN